MKRYRGDPRWVTVQEETECMRCGKPILRGEQAFTYKTGQKYGKQCGCGCEAEAEFEALAADEEMFG